ncbi:MAG: O-antigen ligase family protein [Kiritimatiellae bacterium]|nr:O-antigen ligase family protein [Kiritimatiellia bacterium]MDD5523048.1 O-antigen ligase family protein [Kiritimatiellia bacterium]
MILLNKVFTWSGFGCVSSVVLVAPWLFAAWEMWWFWPFVVLIFLSTLFFSLRLMMFTGTDGSPAVEPATVGRNIKKAIVLSYLTFLLYIFVRFMQADVFMDAEKSFLLFFTPFLLGIQIIFGFDRKQLKILNTLILMDLLFLGLYGVINHLGWKSTYVLWRPGYPQYVEEVRATGTYFCPDHFSGIMEIAMCLALGILLTRGVGTRRKIFAGLIFLVGLLGVLLSKSRGGGLTVLVICGVVITLGFAQWPVLVRWYWRAVIGGLALLALIVFSHCESSYMTRFREHFGWNQLRNKPVKEMVSGIKARLVASCRGQMISAALRAWKEKPVFGIGSGMHQNLWPHIAPSPDGNRELGIWPTFPNNEFHSYEVHSDWVQLLEEYGIVGLILFLVPFLVVLMVLLAGVNREAAEMERRDWKATGNDSYSIVLGGIFACTAMAFHSLGDFNLQMPATVWLMAAIVAIPVAYILNAGSLES